MIDALFGVSASSGWVQKGAADDYWYEARGAPTTAGVDMTEDLALAITTVFACVAKVSKTLATLPLSVVEKTAPNTREPVDHPLNDLLSGAANEDASGLTIRETLSANLELWGNAFCAVDWDRGKTEPRRLTPLPSAMMEVRRDRETGKLEYVYRDPDAGPTVIPPDRMWHIPGLSLNGITGISTVGYNRESLGLAYTATQFGAAFFGNGAWAGGFFQRPLDAPDWSTENANEWLSRLNEKFRGASKAFGFGILREGMEFKQIDMPFEDAMFLNTRKFQRVEICGMFDVPAVMIHDTEHATYSNSEQADLAFSKHSIVPRASRIEVAARRRFFGDSKLYLRHNVAGLQRGDFATRMTGYMQGRQAGWLSINDIRRLEDMNPIEDGDTYLEPLNMKPVGEPWPDKAVQQQALPARQEPEPEPKDDKQDDGKARREAAWATLEPAVRHAADRIATRQIKATGDALRRYTDRPDAFAGWAKKFFTAHTKVVQAELGPLWAGLGMPMPAGLAATWCEAWRDNLLALIDAPTALLEIVDVWQADLAGEIAAGIKRNMTEEN